ncbi:hypothetical protein ACTXT7_000530 [Hymenolepis weldensis]
MSGRVAITKVRNGVTNMMSSRSTKHTAAFNRTAIRKVSKLKERVKEMDQNEIGTFNLSPIS